MDRCGTGQESWGPLSSSGSLLLEGNQQVTSPQTAIIFDKHLFLAKELQNIYQIDLELILEYKIWFFLLSTLGLQGFILITVPHYRSAAYPICGGRRGGLLPLGVGRASWRTRCCSFVGVFLACFLEGTQHEQGTLSYQSDGGHRVCSVAEEGQEGQLVNLSSGVQFVLKNQEAQTQPVPRRWSLLEQTLIKILLGSCFQSHIFLLQRNQVQIPNRCQRRRPRSLAEM